jgi:glycosyltransferase involved in cell wall biosynthesis/SAM-dependent methyltransferase
MPSSGSVPRVSVVVPCYNHARFLPEAIDSVLAQVTRAEIEVIVVDDGSTDDCEGVVKRFPTVRYLRQDNQGPSAARNTGLAAVGGEFVVFLDADDRLLPHAIERGLDWLVAKPELAFVAGHFRYISSDGSPHATVTQPCPDGPLFAALLRTNFIRMHATVMYRRAALQAVGGFDASLRACEDYDAYLRLAREHAIACHHDFVAEYRLHGQNASSDPALILRTALRVLRRQMPQIRDDAKLRTACHEGMASWRAIYSPALARRITESRHAHAWLRAGSDLMVLASADPRAFVRYLGGIVALHARSVLHRVLPSSLYDRLPVRCQQDGYVPPPGRVRLGHLRRTQPISRDFGYPRGTPIDRYYIERFLTTHALDVRGRVLELADASYTRRFGGERVTRSDVLDARGTPEATIVGDLSDPESIPPDSFDCVILTQTLQLVYDTRAALRTVHRSLRRGGILLATMPGLSQRADRNWLDSWYWGFTSCSIQRLAEEVFPSECVTVKASGNVLSTVAFLEGLVLEELTPEELEIDDPQYEMLVTLRAVKP